MFGNIQLGEMPRKLLQTLLWGLSHNTQHRCLTSKEKLGSTQRWDGTSGSWRRSQTIGVRAPEASQRFAWEPPTVSIRLQSTLSKLSHQWWFSDSTQSKKLGNKKGLFLWNREADKNVTRWGVLFLSEWRSVGQVKDNTPPPHPHLIRKLPPPLSTLGLQDQRELWLEKDW